MTALADTDTDECPAGVAPACWPALKETLVLISLGSLRDNTAVYARQFGLTHEEFERVRKSRKWRVQLDEIREKITQTAGIGAAKVGSILMDKLNDPEKVARMSIPDTAKTYKALTDTSLNAANGNTGGIFQNNSYTWADVKVLVQNRAEPPKA